MPSKKQVKKEKPHNELQIINAYCFGLIKRAKEIEAQKMTITQENVTHFGKSIGNWKIIVEKVN